MRVIILTLYGVSVLFAVVIALVSLIFIFAVTGNNLLMLRIAGATLILVATAHCFPLNSLGTKRAVVSYLVVALVAAWAFGVLYYYAETGGPYRDEGELGANAPFHLALCLSILPIARAALRIVSLKIADRRLTIAESNV